MTRYLLLCVLLVFALGLTAAAQEAADTTADTTAVEHIAVPAPVTDLTAKDVDDDHGHAIILHWTPSVDDGGGAGTVMGYKVYRWYPALMDSMVAVQNEITALRNFDPEDTTGEFVGMTQDQVDEKLDDARDRLSDIIDRLPEAHAQYPNNGEWREVGAVGAGSSSLDNTGSKERYSNDFIPDHSDLYYRVDALTADTAVVAQSEVVGPVQASGQWFNGGRIPVLFAVVVFGFLTVFFVERAKRGTELYVRPLAGIEAVDDAIGRATEMGRPILYVLGLGTAADIATIASFTILNRVAKRVAEYQTALIVPTYDPIVMTVAQEVVKSAYLDAGRPDEYNQDMVFFVTQSQFAYVAAVNGLMLRELPATNVYMGKFYAESLLLAETGAVAGSIQISGTDEIAQIPFFIVACDYTLIGEELYAASAYLGREPVLLGSLKAQDWAKAAIIIFGVTGLIAANFGWDWFTSLFYVAN
jgi:hypothetical protein